MNYFIKNSTYHYSVFRFVNWFQGVWWGPLPLELVTTKSNGFSYEVLTMVAQNGIPYIRVKSIK